MSNKLYIVIGPKETDGELELLNLTLEEIKSLGLHKSPDHYIIDGNVLKVPNGYWNLKHK